MDFFDILLAKKLEDDRDPTIEGLSVTENGTYSEENKAYNPVIVNVPEPVLITKTITANGTYTASDDNADGYSSVTVAVEGFKKKSIANTPTDIASFDDGTANPMPSLEISIEPVQSGSGDPSPSNIRPISGWTEAKVTRCGKNICNIGSVSFTRYERYTLLLPPGTYTLSSAITSTDTDGNDCYFGIYDASDSLLIGARLTRNDRTSHTFTLSSNSSYIILYAGHNSSQSVGDDATWANVQIEVGSTATTYEPYNGTTYTIDLDGTRYGGTLDVTSGVLTVEKLMIDLGSLVWVIDDRFANHQFYTNALSDIDYNKNVLCSSYKPVIASWSANVNETIGITSTGQILCVDNNYATASDFRTAMNGVQLVHELATPQTYQLTPVQVTTLLQNNIFADCGQILEGEYFVTL